MSTRRLLLVLLPIGMVVLLLYAAWGGTDPVAVVRYDLRAGASTRWRVVQVSDLHLQAFGMREQSLAQQVKGVGADVVVLSGDAIDRAEALPHLRGFVQALGALPVLLIPGNWEHWSGVSFGALAQSGAHLLLNDRWSLSRDGRTLLILGLDDFTAGQPDLRLLARDDPASVDKLLVQHSPGFFEQPEVNQAMQARPIPLCLSGHTHGGQVAIGGWAPFRPVGSGRFVAGFYDVPGCRLFVSKGVGTSVLPLLLTPTEN